MMCSNSEQANETQQYNHARNAQAQVYESVFMQTHLPLVIISWTSSHTPVCKKQLGQTEDTSSNMNCGTVSLQGI